MSRIWLCFVWGLLGCERPTPRAEADSTEAADSPYNTALEATICRGRLPLDLDQVASHRADGRNTKTLRRILRDESAHYCWPGAAQIFGIVAPLKDYQVIIEYVERPQHVAAGGRRLASYMRGVESLGVLAGRYHGSATTPPAEVVSYLLDCAQPSYWRDVPGFMADEPSSLTGAWDAMARGCIRGLGFARDVRAAAAIQRISEDRTADPARLEAAEQARSTLEMLDAYGPDLPAYMRP